MLRSSARLSSVLIVFAIVTAAGGRNSLAESTEDAVSVRLVEVGLTVEQLIEFARHNLEQESFDKAALERQAADATRTLENLERRVFGLPNDPSEDLLKKLHSVRALGLNLARSAELSRVPPARLSTVGRIKYLDRRDGETRAAPLNDNCEDAFPVGFGAYAGDTSEATQDGEASCGASIFSPDEWYRFVPAESGLVVAETVGSSYDTVLSVHSGCPGTMGNQIVCNDDSAGLQSSLGFWAYPGNEYLIRVSGSNGAVGSYVLTIGIGGAIEGTVTDTQASAHVSARVEVYDNNGFYIKSAYTDQSGSYSLDGLGTGSYFVATDVWNDSINELFDDHPCPGGPGTGCDVTIGDEVSVTIGSVTGAIDFVLDRHGVITGEVRDEATTLPIPDARVELYDHTGNNLQRGYSDGSGAYRIEGIPAGEYYLWSSVSSHLSELHDNILCNGSPPHGCAFADGTTVAVQLNGTTSGINFDLQKNGAVAGTVIDRLTGLPIDDAHLQIYDDNGDWVKSGESGEDGFYEIGGLADGTYFVMAGRWNNYVDQLYLSLDCPVDGCEILTGTPVTVADLATTNGINFGLIRKGAISGHVHDETTGLGIPGVRISVYNDAGSSIGNDYTDAAGNYEVDEIRSGNVFVIAAGAEHFNELYDNLPCPADCDQTSGTPVRVNNAAVTTGIDFAMLAGGKIKGTVTAEVGGTPLRMRIRLYDDAGVFVNSEYSYSGVYEFAGLNDGQYFVLADRNSSSYPYLEALYDDIPCWGGLPEGCVVTDGTPVTAAAATVTAGIDFALLLKGAIAGVVTESTTGAPVSDGYVKVHEVSGAWSRIASDSLNSGGAYRVDELLPGDYVIAVDAEYHRDEVWNGRPCQSEYPEGCNIPGGTPITVSVALDIEDINFSIDRLGSVSGKVRSAASGAPLPSMYVSVYDDYGEPVESERTDQLGSYRLDRLWPGTYFAATERQNIDFVDQLFDGFDCVWQNLPNECDPTTGTPLVVRLNTSTRWIDFNLNPTGSIGGRVTDSATGLPIEDVRVAAWDSAGFERSSQTTDFNGNYLLQGLEEGSFFVATAEFGAGNPSYIDLLFDGIPCPGGPPNGCDPTKGTLVAVSNGGTTTSIDFALPSSRVSGISGTVTDATTGLALEGVQIDIWHSWGEYELGVMTSETGSYAAGLYPDTYVVSTDNPGAWINQIWDGFVCPEGSAYNRDCDPMVGDLITVVQQEMAENINFALTPTFAIFADDFESGDTIRWNTTVN